MQPQWFDTEAILRAVHSVGDSDIPPLDHDPAPELGAWEAAEYASPPSKEWAEYASAASRFHAGQWQAAIAGFDDVVGMHGPHRTDAAYDAARASLDAGQVDDGIRRIAGVLADPDDSAMFVASRDLLGTLSYDADSLALYRPLLAARLTDISHLLTMPSAIRCGSIEARELVQSAANDLSYILSRAYSPPGSAHTIETDWDSQREDVLRELAKTDPVLDILHALAAPTPFAWTIWTEAFYPDRVVLPGERISDQPPAQAYAIERMALIGHARDMALSGNPLWAYALALQSIDPSDLPSIEKGLDRAVASPNLSARTSLAPWLAAQDVRIRLMAGQVEQAIAVVDRWAPLIHGQPGYSPTPEQFLVQGGMNLLIQRREYASAERWRSALLQALGPSAREELIAPDGAPPLTFEEALAPAIKVGRAPRIPDGVAAALDLWSADKLIALERTPGLAVSWRRAILGAAWIRLYILHRDVDFVELFPDARQIFPELRPDLDAIRTAWPAWTRRRLIVRMLLHSPGLTPRVLWNRNGSIIDLIRGQPSADLGIGQIDRFNANDGNWWCPLDPSRMLRDAFANLYGSGTRDWFAAPARYVSVWISGSLPPSAPSFDQLARTWLASLPLTRDADGAQEAAALAKAESGPYRLTKAAVEWSEHSNMLTRWLGLDRALPETLALAVRSTRYGCRRAEKLGPSSKAAWSALHDLYPNTAWARQTPYWFDETAAP